MANTYLFNAYHPGPAFGENGSPWKFRFLDNKWAMHRGQDFPTIVCTPIPAAAKGEIFWNNPLGDYESKGSASL